jgi:hypothetical protein
MKLESLTLARRDDDYLVTRSDGLAAALRVLELTERPVAIELDFDQVEVVSPQFVEELLGGLHQALSRHRDEGVFAVATNMTDVVRSWVELVIAHRRLPGLACYMDGRVDLISSVTHLAETLDVAQSFERAFRAPELAERLGQKLPNTNQRLAALVEAGAVSRRLDRDSKNGKRFVYRAVTPEYVDHARHGVLIGTAT